MHRQQVRAVSATAFAVLAMWGAAVPAARAAVFASEGFNYGTTPGPLAGKNGGTGFLPNDPGEPGNPDNPPVSGAWTADAEYTYSPNGLTFGSLRTAGGAASRVGVEFTSAARRPFAVEPTGVIYGSYLYRIDARTQPGSNNGTVMLGGLFDTDANATFAFQSPFNSESDAGVIRVEAGKTNGFFRVLTAAGAPAVGTTYMSLFRFQPFPARADAWILTAAQYDNFVAGGLTEDDLTGAAVGTGATDVFAYGWRERDDDEPIDFDPMTHLSLFGFFDGGSLTMRTDEIRLSDTSLLEAAPPVPEPAATGLLALAGLATLRRRRRRRM